MFAWNSRLLGYGDQYKTLTGDEVETNRCSSTSLVHESLYTLEFLESKLSSDLDISPIWPCKEPDLGLKTLTGLESERRWHKRIVKYCEYLNLHPPELEAIKTHECIFSIRYMLLKDYMAALRNRLELLATYPDNESVPRWLMHVAFIYDHHLQEYDKAKNYYEEFLGKYPDHTFASIITWSLGQPDH